MNVKTSTNHSERKSHGVLVDVPAVGRAYFIKQLVKRSLRVGAPLLCGVMAMSCGTAQDPDNAGAVEQDTSANVLQAPDSTEGLVETGGKSDAHSSPAERDGSRSASADTSNELGVVLPEDELRDFLADSLIYRSDGGFTVSLLRDGTAFFRMTPPTFSGGSLKEGRYSISGNTLCIEDRCFDVYVIDSRRDVLRYCVVGADSLSKCFRVIVQKGGG